MLKKSIKINSVAVIIKIFALLIINKILAVYTGPVAYAAIGQLQNLMQIITTLSTGAINNGVIRYTAENGNKIEQLKVLWGTSGVITLVFSAVIVLVITTAVPDLIINEIFQGNYGDMLLPALAASVVLIGVNSILLSILNGKKELVRYAASTIFGNTILVLLVGVLTSSIGLPGALLSIIVYQPIACAFTLYMISSTSWFRLNYIINYREWRTAKNLFKYSMMGIITVITVPLSSIIIRDAITTQIDEYHAGLWEALFRLSSSHLLLYTSIFGIYLLPRFSELKIWKEINNEIVRVLKLVLPLACVSTIAIFALKDLIITTLFSIDFIPMRDYLTWQLAGDILKIFGWVMGYVLISKGLTRAYIFTTLYFPAQFVFIANTLMPHFGLKGVTIAHFIGYLIFDVFLILYLIKISRIN